MNCDAAQERFSEFIDNKLDEATASGVAQHLAACANCQAEAEDLAYTIRLAAAEPSLEPAMGFATRVMAHVREEAAQPGFWQGLLRSLRFPMPAQILAVLVVSLLAVFLYQRERPFESVQQFSKTNDKSAAREVPYQLPEPGSKPASSALAKAQPSSAAKARSQAQGLAEPQQGPRALSTAEPAADYVLTVRLRSSARDEKTSAVTSEKGLSQLNRENIDKARRRLVETGRPQDISLSLDASGFDDLKKALAAIGALDVVVSPVQVDTNPSRPLGIKVTLLPPS